MSNKRIATDEIQKDDSSGEEDTSNDVGPDNRASEDVMKRRRIVKGSSNFNGAPSKPPSMKTINPFANIGLNKSATPQFSFTTPTLAPVKAVPSDKTSSSLTSSFKTKLESTKNGEQQTSLPTPCSHDRVENDESTLLNESLFHTIASAWENGNVTLNYSSTLLEYYDLSKKACQEMKVKDKENLPFVTDPSHASNTSTSTPLQPFIKSTHDTVVENDDPTSDPNDGKIEEVLKEQNDSESVVFEVKAKPMKLVDGNWKKYGAGVCRLYRDNETSKHRLVVRNEIGKVLFNVAVNKSMTFKKEEKNGKKGKLAFVNFMAKEYQNEGAKLIKLQVLPESLDGLYSALMGMAE